MDFAYVARQYELQERIFDAWSQKQQARRDTAMPAAGSMAKASVPIQPQA